MRNLLILITLSLCACSAQHYNFKKGDVVYVGRSSHTREFEIIEPLAGGYYKAWDLRTGKCIDRIAGGNLKPVKSSN